MAKRKAITSFSGVALAPLNTNTVLSYVSGEAFSLPYAGTMSRTAKERNGELYYDDSLYAIINEILGEEAELRIAEASLALLATLGLGTYNSDSERLEAGFGVANKSYSLRCVNDTVDQVPFFFMWRVFDLTSIRFDNFATKDTGVKVCEVIIKGAFRKPAMPTVMPMAIMQLKDDASNKAECEAFMAEGETFPAAVKPVITITKQPGHVATTAGAIDETTDITASATLAAVLAYQWYEGSTLSDRAGVAVAGQNTKDLTIPVGLAAGTHYFYCVVSAAGAVTKTSETAVVIVAAA